MSWRRLGKAAYALTGNKDDAEDLLQSVLERTCARWSKIVHENPHAYVRRALVHGYVDGWRRKRRVRVDPTDTVPDTAVLGGRAGMDGVEDRADLTVLLAELSDRERAMVVLRYYLDCSVAGGRGRARLLGRHRQEHLLAGACTASGFPLSRSKGTSDERHRRARRSSTGSTPASPTIRTWPGSGPAASGDAGAPARSGPPALSRPPPSSPRWRCWSAAAPTPRRRPPASRPSRPPRPTRGRPGGRDDSRRDRALPGCAAGRRRPHPFTLASGVTLDVYSGTIPEGSSWETCEDRGDCGRPRPSTVDGCRS